MEWRTINRTPGYEVSTEGDIRNSKTLHILKPYKSPYTKHLQVVVSNNGCKIALDPSREVYRAFIGDPTGYFIQFLDNDPTNVAVENLYTIEPRSFFKRHYENKLRPLRLNPSASLCVKVYDTTESVVYNSVSDCAKVFGCHPSEVSRVCRGITNHVHGHILQYYDEKMQGS